MSRSTNSRSKEWAEKQGWIAGSVEKWVSYGDTIRPDMLLKLAAHVGQQFGPQVEAMVRRGLPSRGGPPGVRQDLFGLFDLIVIDDQMGTLYVQSTAMRGDVPKHIEKFNASPELTKTVARTLGPGGDCLRSNRAEIWAWRKVYRKDARGTRRQLWWPRIFELRVVPVLQGGEFEFMVQAGDGHEGGEG